MPTFTSFDDAWGWFAEGGDLVPIEEQREHFVAGRAQFLSFQAPLADLAVAGQIEELQDDLAGIDGLDLMPRDALHITVRGVGFQVIAKTRPDDIAREEVPRIGERAAASIVGCAPIDVTLGPVNVFPDALILEVHDNGRLGELRTRLDAVERGDVFAQAPAQYLPHVSIGWFRDTSAVTELRQRLPAMRDRVLAPVQIRRIELARWWFTGDDVAETPDRETLRSYLLRG